jgi:hypothetical protein
MGRNYLLPVPKTSSLPQQNWLVLLNDEQQTSEVISQHCTCICACAPHYNDVQKAWKVRPRITMKWTISFMLRLLYPRYTLKRNFDKAPEIFHVDSKRKIYRRRGSNPGRPVCSLTLLSWPVFIDTNQSSSDTLSVSLRVWRHLIVFLRSAGH